MGALRSVFGWIGSKLTRRGATDIAIRTAAAQAQKLPPKAWQAISPPPDGEEPMARGYRIMGFKRELVLGIALGVAVSFIIPGSGLIVQGLVAGWATNAVAAGVGVMASDPLEEPKAAAPDSGKGAEVTGRVGDNTPAVQQGESGGDPVVEGRPRAPTDPGTETTTNTTTTTTTTTSEDPPPEQPHDPPPPDPHQPPEEHEGSEN